MLIVALALVTADRRLLLPTDNLNPEVCDATEAEQSAAAGRKNNFIKPTRPTTNRILPATTNGY